MTDNLVKRLRDTANSGGYDIYGLHCDLELEAADRIVKLEAALRKYADEEYNGFNADGAHARKALEGKDD